MQKKAAFLVAVLEHIRSRLDPAEHGLAAAFTRQFWSRVADEDLEDRAAEDAAGMTIACLRHFQQRQWDSVDIDGVTWRVTDLFYSRAETAKGATSLLPGSPLYGFEARQGDRAVIARWNEKEILFYEVTPQPAAELASAGK